jgi:hypothetical protein
MIRAAAAVMTVRATIDAIRFIWPPFPEREKNDAVLDEIDYPKVIDMARAEFFISYPRYFLFGREYDKSGVREDIYLKKSGTERGEWIHEQTTVSFRLRRMPGSRAFDAPFILQVNRDQETDEYFAPLFSS